MELMIKALNEDEPIKDILSAHQGTDWDNYTSTIMPHGEVFSKPLSKEIPLHIASLKYNKEAVEMLIENEACVDMQDIDGYDALSHLISAEPDERRLPMIDFLVTKGAILSSQSIIKAINENKSLKDLLEANKGINLNPCCRPRNMPFHLAASNYNKDAVEILIENGANVNTKDCSGKDALSHLISAEPDERRLPMMDFLVTKGASVSSGSVDINELMQKDDLEIWRFVMKNKVTFDVFLKMIVRYGLDYEILEYLLGSPTFQFVEIEESWGSYVGKSRYREYGEYAHGMIKELMEKKAWEKAMRLIVISKNANLGVLQSDGGPSVIERIMEHLTDFSYIDESGSKFVDKIFSTCMQNFDQMDADVAKKLLENGADILILNKKLNSLLENRNDIEDTDQIKKYIERGADLNAIFDHYGKERPLVDIIYLINAVYFGNLEIAEDMIARGANIGSILEYAYVEDMLKRDTDDCLLLIINKLKTSGMLNTKMGQYGEETFIDFLKRYNKEEILVKIGLLPKPPTSLNVKYSGQMCTISWTSEKGPEEFPVTGYQIDSLNDPCLSDYQKLREPCLPDWQKAASLVGQGRCRADLTGLEMNERVMFRVMARNEYGLSAGLEEPDYNVILVLPSRPGCPTYEVTGVSNENLFISWEAPEAGTYTDITEYMVEGIQQEIGLLSSKKENWWSLGTVSVRWKREMKIYDYKSLSFNQVRVVAVNKEGKSEPSPPSVLIE